MQFDGAQATFESHGKSPTYRLYSVFNLTDVDISLQDVESDIDGDVRPRTMVRLSCGAKCISLDAAYYNPDGNPMPGDSPVVRTAF